MLDQAVNGSGPLHRPRIAAAFHSIPAGDMVLCNPPPYLLEPWMGAGVPLLHAILRLNGIVPRVVRFLDNARDTPSVVLDTCQMTLWSERPMEERLAAMQAALDQCPEFLDRLMSILLAGPEMVFGFSTYRHNSDLVIALARELKQRRPGCLVIVGGPEAAESPVHLHCEWIDVIVGSTAEGLAPLVARACLDGKTAELSVWEHVWVNPRHHPRTYLTRKVAEVPPLPSIDYRLLLPLFLDDPDPTIPVLMNVGCPFHCGFCTIGTTNPEMSWSTARRLFEEIQQIVDGWADLTEEPRRPPRISMCDSTVNAQPAQFDELCQLLIDATWRTVRPQVHGMFVIDRRVTQERVKLFAAAGFTSLFFGLETASVRLRRVMKKPGSLASVAEGLQNIRDAGEGRINVDYGVIVGWPTETEAEFYETVAFMEWTATLGIVSEANVMPLIISEAAMDPEAFTAIDGLALAWRAAGPAGDPVVRCRRYLYMFEHFAQLLPMASGLSRRLAVQVMMPDAPVALFDAWSRVHGDGNHFPKHEALILKPGELPTTRHHKTPADAVAGAMTGSPPTPYLSTVERILAPTLTRGTEVQGWTLQSIHTVSPDDPERALLEFVSKRDQRVLAVELRPRSDRDRAFKRTQLFNVTLMKQHAGVACAFDERLIGLVVATLAAHEKRPVAQA